MKAQDDLLEPQKKTLKEVFRLSIEEEKAVRELLKEMRNKK